MKKFKKIISIIMVAAVIVGICAVGTVSSSASGTGVGLAEWALNAYYSNWSYVYGGATPGAVDCSGLIYSYAGGYRVGDAQTFNSDYRASLSGGIPNIHGLGLYKPGHVGVYVGNGMAVDARGSDYGVCYESVWSHGWTQYFKVPGVSYPDTGWVEFDGDSYYYENGEYLADTSRTIGGVTYYFTSSGKSSSAPSSSSGSSDTSNSSKESGPLKKGSKGSQVERLQERLAALGYYNGAVDGDFGEATEEAFKRFQKTIGLYADGIAGSDVDYLYADNAPAYEAETEAATEAEAITDKKVDLAATGAEPEATEEPEEPEAVQYSIGDYSDEVLLIQERLITLEYMEGPADGEFGGMTETAVKDFQKTNELEVTGVVEQKTYDKLFSDDAVAAVKPEGETAEANLPTISNVTKTDTSPKTSSVPVTEVERTTSELSAKSVAAVTDSALFSLDANATNFDFLLWMAIMVVVMLITFAIVYAVEKKRQKNMHGRRFQ